jgi:hypothetical protein
MRRISIVKWKVKNPEGAEIEESILSILNALIASKRPEEMPKGLENFRLMKRLVVVFDNAEEKGILELEESEYKLLKNMVEKDIPSLWGTNLDISKAVDNFLEAKE